MIKRDIKNLLIVFLSFLPAFSCKNETVNQPDEEKRFFISAVDISSYPEIKKVYPTFYDSEGMPKEFLLLLKNSGVNTIRLRLWVNPSNEHCGFDEVKQFSGQLKNYGFKIWLALHYSDTWADPSQQQTPLLWQNISFNALKDSVYNYTRTVVEQINPDFIQIGNEINGGFLFPHGKISENSSQFKDLLQQCISAVRVCSQKIKIILHFAGIENSLWFFQEVNTLGYDIIGLSYYPIWHGKSLDSLVNTMNALSTVNNKEIVIAETAYPFTLNWNDWTNNIVGLESQLILPEFPATPQGQRDFIKTIRNAVSAISQKKGIGFCYWGAELIAWKGSKATDGSHWENQALFDFHNKALPVLEEFNVK